MQDYKINNISVVVIIRKCIDIILPVHRKQFLIVVFLLFICALIDMLSFSSVIPIIYLISNPLPIESNYILRSVYQYLNFSSNTHFIFMLLFCLVVIFSVKNTFVFITSYLQNKFVYAVNVTLLEKQFKRFFNISYLDIRNNNSIEYLSYTTTSPQRFSTDILQPFLIIIYESMIFIMVCVALLVYYPQILLLVALSIAPVFYFILRLSKNKLASISNKIGTMNIDLHAFSAQSINGYLDIKLFNKEQFYADKILEKQQQLAKVNIQSNLMELLPRRVFEIIIIFTVALIYFFISVFLHFNTQDIVLILLTFATAAYRLMPSVNDILFNIIGIKSSSFIFDHFSFLTEISDDTGSGIKLDFNDEIHLSKLIFFYEPANVLLSEIDLQIKKGEFLLITGESGSGKSTLGKLLLGLVKPVSGRYTIDNREVLHFNQLKNMASYVTQDFFLFDTSLLENIAIGQEISEINMKRIEEVIQAVNLTEFVQSLSDGIFHIVGENGANISGGQKQRISVARALYKQSQLLILDEITSYLDRENETDIIDTIYNISKKYSITVIMITHRASSVNKYDKIYELSGGKLMVKSF